MNSIDDVMQSEQYGEYEHAGKSKRAHPLTGVVSVSLIIVLTQVTAGCMKMNTGGDFGSVVTQGQKAAIVKGKTIKIDILRELGNPDQRIDLGNGKEQFSYIKESIRSQGTVGFFGGGNTDTSSSYTEFWIVFEGDIVSDVGERPTTKAPNYFK